MDDYNKLIGKTISRVGYKPFPNGCVNDVQVDFDDGSVSMFAATKGGYLVCCVMEKGQNAQDEPTAESGFAKPADAALEDPAGGGSAPSLCSALEEDSEQASDNNKVTGTFGFSPFHESCIPEIENFLRLLPSVVPGPLTVTLTYYGYNGLKENH